MKLLTYNFQTIFITFLKHLPRTRSERYFTREKIIPNILVKCSVSNSVIFLSTILLLAVLPDDCSFLPGEKTLPRLIFSQKFWMIPAMATLLSM